MQLHPDKNPGDEAAQERFQTLSRVYAVLGDEKRRKLYDDTGVADDLENPNSESFEDLYDYYRSMYNKVTEADIDDFERQYRGSKEEERDVVQYYHRFDGDMEQVFAWVMCSDPTRDSHRFADMVQAALASEGRQPSKRFATWEKKVRKRKAPENPLAAGKRRGAKANKENESSLVELIRAKRGSGTSFLDALASKYGVGSPDASEPSEAEFDAAARRRRAAQETGRGGPATKKKKGSAA